MASADVPVADGGLDDPNAPRGERVAQPEIAHDGHDDRPAGQQTPVEEVEGEHGQQLVAVDDLARRGRPPAPGRHRRRARPRAPLLEPTTASCSGRRWVEPQPALMLTPSGSAERTMMTDARGARAPPARPCWRHRWRSRSRPRTSGARRRRLRPRGGRRSVERARVQAEQADPGARRAPAEGRTGTRRRRASPGDS